MLFAAVLALSLAWTFGAACEGPQEQGGRLSKVRCPLTESRTSGGLGVLSVCIAGGKKVGWWGWAFCL